MGPLRERVVLEDWRDRGFDLTVADVQEIDHFFDAWAEHYNRPHITAFRSREAMNAIHDGSIAFFGDRMPKRDQLHVSSALRAGYCVAVTEANLRFRRDPDDNLRQLFDLMKREAVSVQDDPLARAYVVGRDMGEVARKILDDAVLRESLPGFRLRAAVFEDIGRSLFLKLRIKSGGRFDAEGAFVGLMYGHIVGVCEESLSHHTPVAL